MSGQKGREVCQGNRDKAVWQGKMVGQYVRAKG